MVPMRSIASFLWLPLSLSSSSVMAMALAQLFSKKLSKWVTRKRISRSKLPRRESRTSFRSIHSSRHVEVDFEETIDWELRPGGMLVQRREGSAMLNSSSGPLIRVKVFHTHHHHDITIPARATFGDMKKLLAEEIGLQPSEQRILFRGKEKDDVEFLHIAGVMDMAKLMLVEDPAIQERNMDAALKEACQRAIAGSEEDTLKQLQRVQSFTDQMDAGKLSREVSMCRNKDGYVWRWDVNGFGS